jgi:hypothetical protein
MDLVANAVMLHNVADLTDVLSAMVDEGLPVTRELVSHTSPYMREHIRRFGQYSLRYGGSAASAPSQTAADLRGRLVVIKNHGYPEQTPSSGATLKATRWWRFEA